MVNFNYNLIPYIKSKSVAIVGNSDILSEQNYGEIIDNHDVVCRINLGYLRTNKINFGIKTDFLFYSNFNTIADTFQKIGNNTKIVYIGRKHNKKISYIGNTEFILHPVYRRHIRLKTGYDKLPNKKKWPSNGLVTFCIIEDCGAREISLFGFDWKKSKTFYTESKIIGRRHSWKLEETYIKSFEHVVVYE